MRKILVLSDEINSGKTKLISQWKEGKSNVFGILSPKENGTRIFEDAYSGEKWPMEALENENDVLEVGKYRFSRSAFDRAFSAIYYGLNSKGPRTIVFDEIGPLEIRSLGFHVILTEVIILSQQDLELQIVCVVRTSILEQFINKYQVESANVFSVLDFLASMKDQRI